MSACRPEVGAGLSPPYPNSNELPTTQGLPVIWDDRYPLVQAAIAWDTSVLSHLHTTKALDVALVEWDRTCMGSFDRMATQLPFRDNVPPGESVVCGLWAQTASCPIALLAEIVQPAFGHTKSLSCVTRPILKADLVDFLTTPHVHAPCARNSLSHHSMRRMDGISSLADVAAAFHLDTVVWIHSVFCIVGLLNGDARVRQLAMQANLLANTGANICLGNDESLFVDMHDINPIPVGVATTPKDAMQITYCRRMGYLPMLRKDGSTHMQPWYIHPNVVGCMLSPESIMAASPDITSWYQEGFRDKLSPGILCFCNAVGITVLKVTMQKCNGLYYGHTDALSIDHNPIRIHCINHASALCVFTRWTSSAAQPPAAAPAFIEDDESLCGSLASTTTTNPGASDDGGDSLVWNGLPSSGSNGPTCAPVDREARPTQRPCWHKSNQLIRRRSSCLSSGQLAWGIVRSGKWRHSLHMPTAFHQNSIFIHCGLLITKLRLVCASNLQIRQPANRDALANSISVTLDSYGLLPATIPVQTQQLTESSIWLMASTVTCWWWMSSCVMHGYSYVHLRSHPLTRCPHSYGYLALQRVGSYDVTKAGNLPKAPGGICIC
jgi:hypothetical protein